MPGELGEPGCDLHSVMCNGIRAMFISRHPSSLERPIVII